jgi:hypothetical protein
MRISEIIDENDSMDSRQLQKTIKNRDSVNKAAHIYQSSIRSVKNDEQKAKIKLDSASSKYRSALTRV